jgi:serine/threonine-protein kinase HipA
MNYCRITYEPCGEKAYSLQGLNLLSKRLKDLESLPFSADEQRREAVLHKEKMSIQGVQPKLGAHLNVRKNAFELSDVGSTFILKPQNIDFPHLPDNEAVTMQMARICGIEAPISGLIGSKDDSLTYFIRRFDRLTKGQKLAVEDFAQLTGNDRELKYRSSMEKVAEVITEFCSFPALEKVKLFRLTLFNFLVGNEDAHLKNWSLITRNGKIELAPAYDLLNSTIVLRGPNIEEFALPLAGKKRKLTRELLVDYYGRERLKLSEKSIEQVLNDFQKAEVEWERLLSVCFLSPDLKEKYKELLHQRKQILKI